MKNLTFVPALATFLLLCLATGSWHSAELILATNATLVPFRREG